MEYSYLENDDQDAWKFYLKKGLIKQALHNCQQKKKPYVAGIYADQLFLKEDYREAAKYYAESSKTFEEVTLKFVRENLFTCLIDYLEAVLKKVLRKKDQQ